MRRALTHQFVEFIPQQLDEGVLYVSIAYATAAHRCLCGCGLEVVTPLSPTDWKLTFDGETISLSPSIGNWAFPCRSHYWIERNRVRWSGDMRQDLIDAGRARDRRAKAAYYGGQQPPAQETGQRPAEAANVQATARAEVKPGFLSRLIAWLRTPG